MNLTRWCGAVIWLSALTIGLWAPHKPALVVGGAALVLSVVAYALLFWPRRGWRR